MELDKERIDDVNRSDGTFEVHQKLDFVINDGVINYQLVHIKPYTKKYGEQYIEIDNFIDSKTHKVFLAYVDDMLAGQIILRAQWNGYCFIDDIRTDKKFRGMKIGTTLINRAVEFAKSIDLKGLSLETQDTNPNACLFYESLGFKIGGIDTMIYRNFEESKNDTAVYWYMNF